ncbi:hypothetical protein ACH5RR_032025 [Cinchona calisaya]|uniref:Uncharacterized protein n=1 Tax=Cinchona calisaya TaxID=153742 RepID=A0ABD2YM74_9GENT
MRRGPLREKRKKDLNLNLSSHPRRATEELFNDLLQEATEKRRARETLFSQVSQEARDQYELDREKEKQRAVGLGLSLAISAVVGISPLLAQLAQRE